MNLRRTSKRMYDVVRFVLFPPASIRMRKWIERMYTAPGALESFNNSFSSNSPSIRIFISDILSEAERQDDAIAVLRSGLVANPRSSRLLDSLASKLSWNKRFDEIVALMEPYLQNPLQSKAVTAHCRYIYGFALYELYRNEESLRQLQLAEQASGPNASILAVIGNNYLVLDRWADALDTFQKIVAANPKHAVAHWGIACSLSGLGRNDEAISHLELSLELDGPQREKQEFLAGLYESSGQYERAGEIEFELDLAGIREKDPPEKPRQLTDNVPSKIEVIRSLHTRLKRSRSVLSLLPALWSLVRGTAYYALELYYVHIPRFQMREIIEQYWNGILDPGDLANNGALRSEGHYLAVAGHLSEYGDPRPAVSIYKAGLAAFPSSHSLSLGLAESYLRMENFDEAIAVCVQAPSPPAWQYPSSINHTLGRAYECIGRFDCAQQAYLQHLGTDLEAHESWFALARISRDAELAEDEAELRSALKVFGG
jgi:tetratricopeptide (TPR) repeat protein